MAAYLKKKKKKKKKIKCNVPSQMCEYYTTLCVCICIYTFFKKNNKPVTLGL